MKTDRELLELAAKAIGLELMQFELEDGCFEEAFRTISGYWNPLTDYGDALRLAAKLRIATTYPLDENCVRCWYGNEGTEPICLDLGDDPCAATSRAIVLAAAEIGTSL
jgi:hypothetical protein